MNFLSWAIWKPVVPFVAAALLFAVAGAYIKGRSDGYKIQEAEQERIDRVARTASEAAQKSAAEAIAKITVNNTTIKQVIEKEIYEKPVYLDCRHTPNGMLAVNAALTNQSFSIGDSKLPRINSASR